MSELWLSAVLAGGILVYLVYLVYVLMKPEEF